MQKKEGRHAQRREKETRLVAQHANVIKMQNKKKLCGIQLQGFEH
jgi:hypothetical protein